MTATELTDPGLAGRDHPSIRRELFLFPDVRNVLPTTRPDAVVVLHSGPARVDEWTRALVAAGLLEDGAPVSPAA